MRHKETRRPNTLRQPARTLQVSVSKRQSGKKSPENITINTRRGKRYHWIIEQIGRAFPEKLQTPMPHNTKPMLATTTEEAFDGKDWQFEIKWDGYRSLAYLSENRAELRSRNNLSFNTKYPSIIQALEEWPVNAVLDGEIVILSEEGKADFGALQDYGQTPEANLHFFVFDLLWIEGIDLRDEPLYKRREILKKVLPDNGILRYSDSIEECGIDFFTAARDNGLEGIIAKRRDSVYCSGTRTENWYKIKTEQRHEAIICGYTRKKDTDRLFSSLILGVSRGNKLIGIGQVGTGFSSHSEIEIMNRLKPLETASMPLTKKPAIRDEVVWVTPELLCEVKYTELTKEGVMRHPSFQRLRDDKAAADLNIEEAKPKTRQPTEKTIQNNASLFVSKKEDTKVVTIDGHSLKLTNLTKNFWPREGFTKGDVLNYYNQIAPFILPYMLDRPQSLNRFPNGITGKSFYQKDMNGKVEKWLSTFETLSESSSEPKKFLVCANTASLLYMANLGCIELNPWHSRTTSPLRPDWTVIDLDPGDISFKKVIETALVVQKVLDSLSIPSFPKTSGSTGIHIYIPLGGKYSYDQSRQLAELIATLVYRELPSLTSLVRNPALRKDKIYIDYLQNRPMQTICAPYSIRPKPGATVSAPLHWDEVRPGLKMSSFTINTMLQRVKSEGDLFREVMGPGINLEGVLGSLTDLMR